MILYFVIKNLFLNNLIINSYKTISTSSQKSNIKQAVIIIFCKIICLFSENIYLHNIDITIMLVIFKQY